MIQAEELTKSFPTTNGPPKLAVRSLDLHVLPGEVVGLIGPNGAGKTTTLRMLGGLITPTAGRAAIDGLCMSAHRAAAKARLGYLTAGTGLYARLTPREMLRFFATLLHLRPPAIQRRIDELADWLDMRPFLDLRCGSLSTGQKQRTSIARALLADPPALILDEPTLGLDVMSNRVILDFIRSQAGAGKAIILSTHQLDEAESLCQRFLLMHEGSLIAQGSLAELQHQTGLQRLPDIFLALCGEKKHVLPALQPHVAGQHP